MRMTIQIIALLCAAILGSCAAPETPAQREANLARIRKEQAEVQARWDRMTPEERYAKLQTAVALGNMLQQSMQQSIENGYREHEIRALERMARPQSYIITGGGGTYTVWPY